MIAEDVDKFYKKVLKDFILSSKKNKYLLRQLQQNHITINQIEENLLNKLQNTSNIFKKSIHSYSEIQKQMKPRYTNIHEIIGNQKNQIQEIVNNQEGSKLDIFQEEQDSIEDDIQGYSNIIDKKQQIKEVQVKKEKNYQHDQDSIESHKRNSPSEYSLDSSQFNEEYGEMFKKQRENCRIHMVGTYNTRNKKYRFKSNRTEIKLENMFIKVEGISRELFLKKISFVCRKKGFFE